MVWSRNQLQEMSTRYCGIEVLSDSSVLVMQIQSLPYVPEAAHASMELPLLKRHQDQHVLLMNKASDSSFFMMLAPIYNRMFH